MEDWTIQFFELACKCLNLVLSNGSEHMRNVIQWHWNSLFFQKNCPASDGFAPISPFVIRLSYTSLLNTSPNWDISPLTLVNHTTATVHPFHDIFVPQKLSKMSDDVIACDLWSPTQSKTLATPVFWLLCFWAKCILKFILIGKAVDGL